MQGKITQIFPLALIKINGEKNMRFDYSFLFYFMFIVICSASVVPVPIGEIKQETKRNNFLYSHHLSREIDWIVFVPQDDGICYRLPVVVTSQPYEINIPASEATVARQMQFEIIRVQSTIPEHPFSFSMIWPETHKRLRPPLIFMTNVTGKTYIVWTWGTQWLFLAETGTGNIESEVLEFFLSETEAQEHPNFGLSNLAAVINLPEVLGPKIFAHYCQLGSGSIAIRIKTVDNLPNGQIAFHFRGLQSQYGFILHGYGHKWEFKQHYREQKEHLPLHKIAPTPEDLDSFGFDSFGFDNFE